jgi:hypothetical protein
MARDRILDDAANGDRTHDNSTSDSTQTDDVDATTEGGSEGGTGESERVKRTQQVPPELLDEIERVQEKCMLPSRNATINFMRKQATEDH